MQETKSIENNDEITGKKYAIDQLFKPITIFLLEPSINLYVQQ